MTDARLDRLRYQVQQRVSRYVAESLRHDEYPDIATDSLVRTLTVDLLAEKLPPQTITDAAHFEVPRFASWRDHLYATYRERWWARWMPRPQFVAEPHRHVTTVTVQDHWTYPQATMVLPGGPFGHVVLRSDTRYEGEVHPWG